MDAGFYFWIMAVLSLVSPVHFLDQVDLGSLEIPRHSLVPDVGNEFADVGVLGVDVSPLVSSGEECGSPILRFDNGNSSGTQ